MGISEGFEVDLYIETDGEDDVKIHITGVIKPISFLTVTKPTPDPNQPGVGG